MEPRCRCSYVGISAPGSALDAQTPWFKYLRSNTGFSFLIYYLYILAFAGVGITSRIKCREKVG